MIKAKSWSGKDLTGIWDFSIKIDGVRMLRDDDGNPVSRSGKPLYHLENLPKDIVDAEIYASDWGSSVSLVRSKATGSPVQVDQAYPLGEGKLDSRLFIGVWENPTKEDITSERERVVGLGHEGLVLRQGTRWLKVKPTETYDVEVLGKIEGKGKYEGMLGTLVTSMGNVGTGFTDNERRLFWDDSYSLRMIEVECMSLTKEGKFRHPRFIRERWDK